MPAIYLDYNATTPVCPEVFEEMRPFLDHDFGNPSSAHAYGRAPAAALTLARERVADLLGCEPAEIVFTGGGSEADNLAVKGVVAARRGRFCHVITTSIEHPAVLLACRFLESHGHAITVLPVDSAGRVDPAQVEAAITERTALISVMHANNETGSMQPMRAIADAARRRGIPLHTDAAQSAGKTRVHVDELGVDLLTLAGHKFYAPKGVGVLYVRRGTPLEPLIHGGGQERGLRAGTENVALIAGMGKAAELARGSLSESARHLRRLRDRLHTALESRCGPVSLNGHPTERLPNTLNVSFDGVDGAALLAALPEVAASTGSACHAGHSEPSPVLTAMGLTRGRALGAIRLSVGLPTTEAEIDRAAALIADRVAQLRSTALEATADREPAPPHA